MTITIPDLSDDCLKAELERRGYRVTKDNGEGWMTLTDLAAKCGRGLNSMSRTIRWRIESHGSVPGLEIDRTGNGTHARIRSVRASEAFYTWLNGCISRQGHPNERRNR